MTAFLVKDSSANDNGHFLSLQHLTKTTRYTSQISTFNPNKFAKTDIIPLLNNKSKSINNNMLEAYRVNYNN